MEAKLHMTYLILIKTKIIVEKESASYGELSSEIYLMNELVELNKCAILRKKREGDRKRRRECEYEELIIPRWYLISITEVSCNFKT